MFGTYISTSRCSVFNIPYVVLFSARGRYVTFGISGVSRSYINGSVNLFVFVLLPSAMKFRRFCFYTCLSVHREWGCIPTCTEADTPRSTPPGAPPRSTLSGADTPRADTPQGQTPPQERRLLLRTVCILLECIFVISIKFNLINLIGT